MSLLEGAVDLHVHSYPDLMPRSVDDITMARLARKSGMAGFVLKSHYAPTAERAWLVNQAVPGVRAIGSVVLNHFVGGLNPLAADVMARSGGRVVFMPTSDAANEARVLDEWDLSRPLPPYLQIKLEQRERGRLRPPIRLVDERGTLVHQCHEVLEVAKDHNLVIATGHVSSGEALALVRAAHEAGIRRVLITHPESPHIATPLETQLEMVRYGATIERCFAYLDTEAVAERAFAQVRATGVQNNVLSSDLGMVGREDPVAGLAELIRLSQRHGFTDDEIRQMVVSTPARLVGMDG